ncbi:MAG: aldo/keto reductase [Promethearchaeota archaeon]
MKYIYLGRTNLKVSRIGLGGIPLQRPIEKDAIKLIQHAINSGINLLDTSRGYGTSEERIGKAIKGRREDLIIVTRTWITDNKIASNHLELSLKTLDTDYIDIWQFHNINSMEKYQSVISKEGTYNIAKKALNEGKIHFIGITSHNIDVMKVAIQSNLFDVILFPFNFVNNDAEGDLLKLIKKYDVGFLAMKPFAGGRILNTELALKYLLQFENIVPIPGVEKIEEIDNNINVLNTNSKLRKAEKREIKRIRKSLGFKFCQWCGYCMSVCPQKIYIPGTINLKVAWDLWPQESFIPDRKDDVELAKKCTECGACERICPYNLPIRSMLKEAIIFYNSKVS